MLERRFRPWNPCGRHRRGQWQFFRTAGSFRTFKGIAPNANIVDLRVLDPNGMSSDSVVIAAIERAVSSRTSTTFG